MFPQISLPVFPGDHTGNLGSDVTLTLPLPCLSIQLVLMFYLKRQDLLLVERSWIHYLISVASISFAVTTL